jgi:predicted RNA-binding Zn-ribbon protein involved in translation (DUF1610 family)
VGEGKADERKGMSETHEVFRLDELEFISFECPNCNTEVFSRPKAKRLGSRESAPNAKIFLARNSCFGLIETYSKRPKSSNLPA